jgi:hypothetical protein
MKKFNLFVLAFAGLLALTLPAQAQHPYDYFDAGRYMEFTNNSDYLRYYSPDGLKSELQNGRQLFVNATATPAVLASYDKLVATSLKLFNFDYSTWTKAQQAEWDKSEIDPNALNAWLGTNMDTKPAFFFWLGNQAMIVGKTVPSEFGWGYDLATAQSIAKPALQKFVTFRDDCPTTFKTLRPQLQAAVQAIAKYNDQADNLSRDDINAIQKQAALILLYATKHNLTQ